MAVDTGYTCFESVLALREPECAESGSAAATEGFPQGLALLGFDITMEIHLVKLSAPL